MMSLSLPLLKPLSPGLFTTHLQPSTYMGSEGARVVRVPYRRWLPQKIMRKLRGNVGVMDELVRFKPNAILFHGTCGWEVRTAARYVQRFPETRFYIDSHEDWNNSARSFISREILHKLYYGPVLRSAASKAGKILCVNSESIEFVHDLYRVPREMLEFFPLGGHPIAATQYQQRRDAARKALGVTGQDFVVVQSGKQTQRKKLIESLKAFSAVDDPRLRLFITGMLADDIRVEAEDLIKADARVTFLGWKSSDELTDILCGADVYLQPGTQSVTMQHSLCCRCPVILDDVPSHEIYKRQNGWFVQSQRDLEAALREVPHADLGAYSENSYRLACEMLDYSVLAQRILR